VVKGEIFMDRKIIVTGCAGFIGFHVSKKLLLRGYHITGLDNLNSYYDVSLKRARLKILKDYNNFHFNKCSLEDRNTVSAAFRKIRPDAVINLAAQAGVRYSLKAPETYINSNIAGFLNILEACRHYKVKHLIFASSSSVYGANTRLPFSVHDNTDHPLSLYAATKKSGELMAHTYSSLFKLPVTGLRFFTVYGPWGRPDMALFLFTKSILAGKPIKVFNQGNMERDFTYIDDVAECVVRIINKPPCPDLNWSGDNPDPSASFAPYRIYNIGNNNPVKLETFINVLEEKLGRKAVIEYLPLQPGDVPKTYADVEELMGDAEFRPDTPIEDGIGKFVEWYRNYYGV
jgi:UDP-glucuronate 4-epimerase